MGSGQWVVGRMEGLGYTDFRAGRVSPLVPAHCPPPTTHYVASSYCLFYAYCPNPQLPHSHVTMKLAYLDCASGISGDMTLGALVDAGVELDALNTAVGSLGLPKSARSMPRPGTAGPISLSKMLLAVMWTPLASLCTTTPR